jgi:hypothetical protein
MRAPGIYILLPMIAGLGMVLEVPAWAGSSANFRLEHTVVDACGGTAASMSVGGRGLIASGGQPISRQSYGNAYSAQLGFFNEYFGAIPTMTATPTAIPTPSPMPAIPQAYFKLLNSQINPINNERTIIRWCQPSSGCVTINIYNLLGDRVILLVDKQNFQAGQFNEAAWDGRNQDGKAVGSGIYIVYLQAGSFQSRGKIAVVK